MNHIADNIIALQRKLPRTVSLVVVSKTRTQNEILEAYNAGQHIFGENRVQELLAKKRLLPDDIIWHLIGHLQTNKVKHIVPVVSMIESVDSIKLLSLINAEAANCQRKIDCLLQVHIAEEEVKTGFDAKEIETVDWQAITLLMPNIRIRGLMGIATFTDDRQKVRSEFRSLASMFRSLKKRCFNDVPWFNELSMGMSGDWEIAVEEGSTIIRVGTIIFGKRIN